MTTKHRAITLVELVIVMVIVALLAAMAMPRFANVMRHQRLDTASRRIMDDLRAARFASISRKREHAVQFDLSEQIYAWGEVEDPAESCDAVQFGQTPYEGIELKYVSFVDGSRKVIFDHLGVPDSGGQIVIADGTEKVTLLVSPTTGRVTRTFSEDSDY